MAKIKYDEFFDNASFLAGLQEVYKQLETIKKIAKDTAKEYGTILKGLKFQDSGDIKKLEVSVKGLDTAVKSHNEAVKQELILQQKQKQLEIELQKEKTLLTAAEIKATQQKEKEAAAIQKQIDKENKLKEALTQEINSIEKLRLQTNAMVAQRDKMVVKTEADAAARAKLTTQIAANTVKLKAFDEEIGRSQRNVGNYPAGLKKIGDSFKTLFASMTVANLAASAVSKVLSGFKSFITDTAAAAAAAAKSVKILTFAVDGNKTAVVNLLKFADKLENTIYIKHTEIEKQEAFLALQGRSEAQIKKTIIAAADMAAVTGEDLDSAVKKLDGTMEGNLGRMGKMDGSLKELTKDQLKSGLAVDIIAAKYKGMAETTVTLGAKLTIAKEKFKEAIGDETLGFVKGLKTAWLGMLEAITDLIDTPLSEKLAEEKDRVNALAMVLKDSNSTLGVRKAAYKELVKIAPDVVAGIDAENVSIIDLNKNLAIYNKQMIVRITLQANEEKIIEANKEASKALVTTLEQEVSILKKVDKIQSELSKTTNAGLTAKFQYEAGKLSVEEYARAIAKLGRENGVVSISTMGLYTQFIDSINLLSKREEDYVKKQAEADQAATDALKQKNSLIKRFGDEFVTQLEAETAATEDGAKSIKDKIVADEKDVKVTKEKVAAYTLAEKEINAYKIVLAGLSEYETDYKTVLEAQVKYLETRLSLSEQLKSATITESEYIDSLTIAQLELNKAYEAYNKILNTLPEKELAGAEERSEKTKLFIEQQKDLYDEYVAQKTAEKELLDTVKDTTEQIIESYITRSEAKQKALDDEIAASKTYEEQLRELAVKGIEGSENNLAFEQRKRAELEKKKQQELKKQKRLELGLAAITAYGNAEKDGDKNSLSKTITEITKLLAFVNSIPEFAEGVIALKGRKSTTQPDDTLAKIGAGESVITAPATDKYYDQLNDMQKLRYNPLDYVEIPRFTNYNEKAVEKEMLKKLDILTQTIENKTEYSIDINALTNEIVERVKKGNTITQNNYKRPFLR